MRVADGRLLLHDIPLTELAGRYGTPLYVYDAETLRARVRAYRDAFAAEGPARIGYSAKACALVGVLHVLRPMPVSAASLGELEAAVRAGIPASRCWLHGNAKTDEEIRGALALGVGRIVIDGEREHERIARAVRGRAQRVWVRVAPDVVADTHSHLRTSGEQKFGLPTGGRGTALVLEIARTRGLRLVGVHAHVGSQIADLETFRRVAAWLASFALELRDDGVDITEVCVGGGVAVPEPAGPEPDLIAYARAVAAPVHEALPDATVVVEPGRSMVARSAVALYRVQDRKVLPSGRVFIAVDGGMGDNIRPALYGARYEAAVAERSDGATEHVTIAGAFCEAGDVLIEDAVLPRADIGDLVVVPAVGAYSVAMASNYNQRPRPAVVLVDRGRARLIRRRERAADLFRLERVSSR
ncbi:MAG: diaminopimelate decarboxylase [Chloroflexi bacterium 13_1_40CM_4_68_4]|nr:MAG: diaminopimelate decarboxylase [Chloroflexi bacterium 13_1_40CM_4_68_4]